MSKGRKSVSSNLRAYAFRGGGGGPNETFTVRKESEGVGVERIFPVHSPRVAKIEVVRRGVVNQSKLYYLRDRSGKEARIRERIRSDA